MKKILYAKANMSRKPEYRILTRIIEENGKKYVEKAAMESAAISHIQTIKRNYEQLKGLYSHIQILPYEEIDSATIRFRFLEKDESVCCDINQTIWEAMFDFCKEKIRPFQLTEDFEKLFPKSAEILNDFTYKEDAIEVANIDNYTQKFIIENGVLWLFDYEWFFPLLLPIDYIKYRSFIYGTIPNDVQIEDVCNTKYLELYQQIDEEFQQMVHGFQRECSYKWNYRKPLIDMELLQNQIKEQEYEIGQKDAAIIDLVKKIKMVKRGIKNPFYGLYLGGSVAKRKIKKRMLNHSQRNYVF